MGLNFQKKEFMADEVKTVQVTKGQEVVLNEHTTECISGFIDPPAEVGLSMGCTVNIGNYNNVKMHVSLHRPCVNEEGLIETTFAFVKEWVDSKLEQVHDSMLKEDS